MKNNENLKHSLGDDIDDFTSLMLSQIPRRHVVSETNEAINNYIEDPTEENWEYVRVSCYFLLKHAQIKELGGGVEGFTKQKELREDMMKRIRFFDTEDN